MASNAISGVGTQFLRSDMASAPVFTAIAEVNSITGPGNTRETIDVTSLDSTGGWREFITGFRDGGTIELTMNFTVGGYAAFLADFNSDTPVDYQIILSDPNNTQLDFAGLVTDLPLDIPTDDKVTQTVTIKISGPVTLTS